MSTIGEVMHVLCVQCSAQIEANSTMMCAQCLQSEIDVTQGISRQLSLQWCSQCDRYLRPPNLWTKCELESRDLLGICLKKVKGLKEVKLVDAGFQYTEPHSRRLKVKLTVQREVQNGAVLQQSLVIEIIVQKLQCEDCKKTFTPHSWTSLVQLRQRVDHKRSLYFLEQMILKHNAHEKVTGVKQKPDGLDFCFMNRGHALAFTDYISSALPAKHKESKQLVSHDSKSNTYNYKYTIYVELCPVCKDDLVLLDKETASRSGGMGRLLVCTSINTALHLMDPQTCRSWTIHGSEFWKHNITPIAQKKQLTTYCVLDLELVVDAARRKVKNSATRPTQKWQLCEIEICKEEEMGMTDASIRVKCHLANKIKVGDLVVGYDMRSLNVAGWADDGAGGQGDARGGQLQEQANEVLILKKGFRRKTQFADRPWMLKTIEKEVDPMDRINEDQEAIDQEEFKREIEEDEELQKDLLIYKDPHYVAKPKAEAEEDSDSEDDIPEVALAQLLDDLDVGGPGA